MMLYRLFDIEGEGVGEIELPYLVTVGDELPVRPGRTLRVVSVVPVMDEESQYDALVMVGPA
jgi:hypothetical protein